MEEIAVKISSVVYANYSNGYTVLRASDDTNKQITVRCTTLNDKIECGNSVKFNGKYENHPTYGIQFSAISYEILPEQSRRGIISYLSSNVKSVGPITASKMYDVFGDDLINILNKDIGRLNELKFLNKIQIEAIIKEWKVASESRTLSVFLADLGLTASQVKSVITKFGIESKSLIEDNPYKLYECSSIGFITADQAARKLGIGSDDIKRVRAMILFVVNELSQGEGHVCVTSDQVIKHFRKIFKRNGVEPFSYGDYIQDSIFYSELMNLRNIGDVVIHNDYIYLPWNWMHEFESAKQVALMVGDGLNVDIGPIVKDFELKNKIEFSDEQKTALLMLNSSKFCVVSGYPGTGKTTLISAFVSIFEHLNMDYTLLSPTGIAAKRLSQVTNKQAYTIHRALGCTREGIWEFNSSNKYTTDAVVVDESSMVDMSTFYHLITALRPGTIVVLIGDVAQLPSVGAGYVLHEFMQSNNVPHTSLTKIYRQDACSDIIKVAHSILKNEPVDVAFNKSSEFLFIPLEEKDVILEISKLTSLLKSKKCNFQVMAPMYDGELGVNNLNKRLRETLNQDGISRDSSKIKQGEVDIYEGDRVIVIKNDYDKMIFNGDVGKVQRINIKQDVVEVKIFDWFDNESGVPRYIDKIFTFKVEEARSILKVAYATSIHRTQGKEMDYVVLPMTMKYSIMLYKNLIYTAITRAKKKVFMFGDPAAFQFAIGNDRETTRNSNLSNLIGESVNVGN